MRLLELGHATVNSGTCCLEVGEQLNVTRTLFQAAK